MATRLIEDGAALLEKTGATSIWEAVMTMGASPPPQQPPPAEVVQTEIVPDTGDAFDDW